MDDMLVAPIWFAANLLSGVACWQVGLRLFPTDSLCQRVLHALVLWMGCITGAGIGLGAIGFLRAVPLVIGVVSVSVALLLLTRRLACHEFAFNPEVTASSPVGSPSTHSPSGVRLFGRAEGWWPVAWGLLFAVWIGHLVVNGVWKFPSDWDSMMYHIPLVDQWLRVQGLYAPDCAVWYNPGNTELLGLWMVGPFSGDFLIALQNLPAAFLLAFGTVELARGFGLPRTASHLTALAVVSNYVVLRQLTDTENDVAVAGLFGACLGYGVRYARGARFPDLLFASISLGLLAGVKYYALGYAGVAGAATVSLTLLYRGVRPAAQVTVVLLAGAVGWGGYWYLRNAAVTGSPVYPMGLGTGHDTLSELYPDAWRSTFLGSGQPEVLPLLIEAVWKMAGPCQFLALLAVPTTVGWLVATGLWSRRGAGKETERTGRVVLALAAVGAGLVLGITPFAVETTPGTLNMLKGFYLPVRFGLSFLNLATLGLVILLWDLLQEVGSWLAGVLPLVWAGTTRRVLGYGSSLVFTGVILFQFTRHVTRNYRDDLAQSVLLAANLAILGTTFYLVWQAWPGWRMGLGTVVSVAAMAGAAWAGDRLAGWWHQEFAAHYDKVFSTQMFSRLATTSSPGSCVCAVEYRYYPFFGSRRQFRACRPIGTPSYPALLRYVRTRGADFVAVVAQDAFENGAYRDASRWLDDHPDLFKKIEDGPVLWLFRVNRDLLDELPDHAAPSYLFFWPSESDTWPGIPRDRRSLFASGSVPRGRGPRTDPLRVRRPNDE